jgi:sugar lactone lactonase YvrE
MRFVCAVLTVVLLSTAAFAESLTVTNFVGTDGGAGYSDGNGSAARFASPFGLALDGSGNLLVADRGAHTIRHVTPSGAVTTFAGVAGESGNTNGRRHVARFSQPSAVAVDISGNVYVAEASLRRISPSGAVTTLVPVIPGSFGLAVDRGGNVFLADAFNDRILKITPSGSMTTYVSTPQAPYMMTIDGSDNLYFTGVNSNNVYKCTPLGVITLIATVATPFSLHGLDVDAAGNLYVSANDRIVKVAPNGTVTNFAGGGLRYADGVGAEAGFFWVRGVTLSPDDSVLYVVDEGDTKIRKITVAGAVVTTLAGKANELGYTNGTGFDARFFSPSDVVLAPDGNLYLASFNNARIRKITPAGVTSDFAGSFAGNVDGPAAEARFGWLAHIAVGYAGSEWVLYVADRENNSVRRITQAGVVTTIATGLRTPIGVAVAADGDVYVSEIRGNTIRKIDMPSGTMSVFAGAIDEAGYTDGTGTAARFDAPAGLTIDNSGNLFVADAGNQRIRRIVLATAAVTTYAGSGAVGDADGIGTAATFYNPSDLLAIGGDLYVTTFSGTIRLIEPGAVVTTVAGAPRRYADRDGTGSIARFTGDGGLGGDSHTNLYVADYYGNRIRKARRPGLADVATASTATPAPLTTLQLDTDPDTATTWTWSIERRPTGSNAQLSSTTTRNPTFVPDAGDLYTFLLRAEGANGTIRYSTVDVTATACADPLASVVASTTTTAVCTSGTNGTASASVSGGAGATYQWGYRTASGGAITPIGGETSSTYSIDGSDLAGLGTRYLVVTVTPSCGVPTVSNELPLEVTAPAATTISASSGVFANSSQNFASVADAGATYSWSIANGTITAGQGTRSIEYTAGASGTVAISVVVARNGCQATGSANVAIQTRPAGATMLYTVTPCRAVDTRGGTAIANGETRNIPLAGVCGIPTDAKAVVANVTAVGPLTDGWLALWPAGTTWGGTSTMSYRTGRTRANNTILPLPANGSVSLLNSGGPQHVLIDVTGYFR